MPNNENEISRFIRKDLFLNPIAEGVYGISQSNYSPYFLPRRIMMESGESKEGAFIDLAGLLLRADKIRQEKDHVKDHIKVHVLAGAGDGKTTTLRRLQQMLGDIQLVEIDDPLVEQIVSGEASWDVMSWYSEWLKVEKKHRNRISSESGKIMIADAIFAGPGMSILMGIAQQNFELMAMGKMPRDIIIGLVGTPKLAALVERKREEAYQRMALTGNIPHGVGGPPDLVRTWRDETTQIVENELACGFLAGPMEAALDEIVLPDAMLPMGRINRADIDALDIVAKKIAAMKAFLQMFGATDILHGGEVFINTPLVD